MSKQCKHKPFLISKTEQKAQRYRKGPLKGIPIIRTIFLKELAVCIRLHFRIAMD